MNRPQLTNKQALCVLTGVCLVAVGLWLIWKPLALIACGLLLILFNASKR